VGAGAAPRGAPSAARPGPPVGPEIRILKRESGARPSRRALDSRGAI